MGEALRLARWGYAAFEADPLNTEVSAYTWWGGFFSGGVRINERAWQQKSEACWGPL